MMNKLLVLIARGRDQQESGNAGPRASTHPVCDARSQAGESPKQRAANSLPIHVVNPH
jgi:hypothetical protein